MLARRPIRAVHRHVVCVATVLFGLLFGGNLLHRAHFAFEAHSVCPEHGDVLHGDRHAAEVGELGVSALHQAPPHQEGHGHDGCSTCLGELQRFAQRTPAPADAPRAHARDAAERDAAYQAVLVGRALYLLAPKQSPPV